MKYQKVDEADGSESSSDDDDDEQACTIGSNGLEKLCNAIGIDADTDEIVILFAWKCGAARMGFFSLQEFQRGMSALGADSEDSLKKKLAELRVTWEREGATRELMNFVFEFSRESEQVRTIDPAMAAAFVQLLLGRTVHGAALAEFVEQQTQYRGINSDQFIGLWEFATRVDKDFNGYDEDGAWPLLIDNFVEKVREEE